MANEKVFIATDTFVAFIDRTHEKHIHAAAFFRFFAQERYLLYTNAVVIEQTYQTLYSSMSSSLARDFLKALSLSNINLLYPEESDMKLTMKTILNYNNTELHFDEALMAVLCNKRNIPQICTFSYIHQLFGLTTFYLPI